MARSNTIRVRFLIQAAFPYSNRNVTEVFMVNAACAPVHLINPCIQRSWYGYVIEQTAAHPGPTAGLRP